MERSFAIRVVVGAAMSLPINGDHITVYLLERLHPGEKPTLELLRIDAGEHTPEGVVRRNAVGQIQKGGQPGELIHAEFFYVDPAIRTTDHRTNRNNNDVEQGVVFGALYARIGNRRKILANRQVAQ